VVVWHNSNELGIICFDKAKNDIYFANPDPIFQQNQIRIMRFSPPAFNSLSLQMFISTELIYTEFLDKVRKYLFKF
jgi:hypothetical protein